jgi:hypothetical protein
MPLVKELVQGVLLEVQSAVAPERSGKERMCFYGD